MEVDQDKSAKAEDPNRRHKNQRSTHSHTQESYKTLNWKVEYKEDWMQTCSGPVNAASVLESHPK